MEILRKDTVSTPGYQVKLQYFLQCDLMKDLRIVDNTSRGKVVGNLLIIPKSMLHFLILD